MNTSSGTRRSRCIIPSSPLTDKKIDAYILQGRYGIFAQQQLKAKLSKKKPKKRKPAPIRLHKNSLAQISLNSIL